MAQDSHRLASLLRREEKIFHSKTVYVSLPGTSSISDILKEARNLFSPQGESTFGSCQEMEYSLASFKGDNMDKLKSPEGKSLNSPSKHTLISTSYPVLAYI